MNIVEEGTEKMQCEPHTQHPQSNKCCLCLVMCRGTKNMRKKKLIQVLHMLHDSDPHTSSIAILMIWLLKPNVFELHAPISEVAMLGCYRDVVNLCACGWFLFHFV